MITIRNEELFKELQEAYKNGASERELWDLLFTEDHERRDWRIPCFAGALDHIEVRARGVYFVDRGANDKDNSFVIRPEV